MVNASFETGINSLPKSVHVFLQEFLNNRSHYTMLVNELSRRGLILEKDGYQIPLSSVEELNATVKILGNDRVIGSTACHI